MSERWLKPAVVIDVEEHPTQVYDMPDGRTFGGVKMTVDRDTWDRMRLGYMCALCQQPFRVPWPEQCWFCGTWVREQQAEYLARQYEGHEDIPTTEWDVEQTLNMWELLAREQEKGRQ